jgi:filamentous hemagglutinin
MAKRVSSPDPDPVAKPKPRTLETAKNRAKHIADAKRKSGKAFNESRKGFYEYDEVPIAKPYRGRPYFLDSYDPVKGEIVSRKDTQLSEITENSAINYLRELTAKYHPGSRIADVPSAKDLAGQKLTGKMILEVPPQWKRVPRAILEEAERLDITIRDTNLRVYHAD